MPLEAAFGLFDETVVASAGAADVPELASVGKGAFACTAFAETGWLGSLVTAVCRAAGEALAAAVDTVVVEVTRLVSGDRDVSVRVGI